MYMYKRRIQNLLGGEGHCVGGKEKSSLPDQPPKLFPGKTHFGFFFSLCLSPPPPQYWLKSEYWLKSASM